MLYYPVHSRPMNLVKIRVPYRRSNRVPILVPCPQAPLRRTVRVTHRMAHVIMTLVTFPRLTSCPQRSS